MRCVASQICCYNTPIATSASAHVTVSVERTLEECLNATVHLQSSPASLFLVTPWIASKYLLYLQASSSRQYTNRETTGSQQAGKACRDTLKQNTLQSSRLPSNEFNYRTNQMVQLLSPSATTNLMHQLVGI